MVKNPAETFDPSITISLLASRGLSPFQQVHIDYCTEPVDFDISERLIKEPGKMQINESSYYFFLFILILYIFTFLFIF